MDQIKYLTACPDLSKDAPVGHPHLVDVSTVDMDFPRPEPGLGIADMVVTVLFNHSPETLQRFLDLSHNFKFWIRHRAERGSLDFCIIRDGLTVTVRIVSLLTNSHILISRSADISPSQRCVRCNCGTMNTFTA